MWGQIIGAGIGAASSLLGGGSETPKLPRHIRRAGKESGRNAADFASQYGSGQGLYSGNRLTDFDPLIGQGENALLGQLPGLQSQLNNVGGTLEGFLDYNPNSPQNQARRDALGANITSLFNESIRPGIENRGTFAGQFGGNQQSLALGAATAPLSRSIADAEVAMMEGDRNRAFNAMGIAPSLFASQLMPNQLMSQIGAGRTARDQLSLEDMIQLQESGYTNALRGNLDSSSIVAGLSGAPSYTPNPQGNALQGALGGGILGSQLGSLFGGGNQVPSYAPSTGVEGLNYAIPFSGGSNL